MHNALWNMLMFQPRVDVGSLRTRTLKNAEEQKSLQYEIWSEQMLDYYTHYAQWSCFNQHKQVLDHYAAARRQHGGSK